MKPSGFSHETTGVTSVEWYTPPWIFQALGLEFDLDPAAPEGGLDWIPARKFYDKSSDGLTQEWQGLVWCNPPYGKYTQAWMRKMSKHGNGVALVFSRTDCQWYHDSVATADAILYLKGRVRFVDAKGDPGKSSPGAGSLLAAWGCDGVAALKRMSEYGHLILKEVNYRA